MENSRLLNQKINILWQFKKLQNSKDLYGKSLEHDMRAKHLLPIQILLISSVHTKDPS